MVGIVCREALLIRNTSLADPAFEISFRAVMGPIAGAMVSAIRYGSSAWEEPDIFYEVDVSFVPIIDADWKHLSTIYVYNMQ